jgi:hypothetical protein
MITVIESYQFRFLHHAAHEIYALLRLFLELRIVVVVKFLRQRQQFFACCVTETTSVEIFVRDSARESISRCMIKLQSHLQGRYPFFLATCFEKHEI